jgi:hypothetical protein
VKSKISISLDKSVIIAMKEKAKEENRTLSNYINMILKEKIEREK